MTRLLITSAILGVSLAYSSFALAHNTGSNSHQNTNDKRLLPINADAQITTSPDQATIRAGVLTDGKNAADTAEQNARKMTAIFKALNQIGISSTDIRTTQLSLTPQYSYESKHKPRITGYSVRNTVAVNITDLSKLSAVIDALVEAGSNNIQNVRFSLVDPDALKAKALQQAIKKARDKAELVAQSAGVKLGQIQTIDVNDSSNIAYNRNYDQIIVTGAKQSRASEPVSTPVSQGEIAIRASVKIIYEMN